MTYVASRIKRQRATNHEMDARRQEVMQIARECQPATVRQVFYQATVRGVVEKTETGYAKVQRILVELRKGGHIPYGWIVDNTRMQLRQARYHSASDAIENVARFYRKQLWTCTPSYVEIWLEKDALSGVIYPVTNEYDVPLMVARGYASLSFLHTAAEDIERQDRPAYIYHLGDFDPSGVDAARKIERTLREMAPSAEIHFERLAVTPWQIEQWNLPSRPTKQSDTRARSFGQHESVELDSIPPEVLRDLVRRVIENHLPQDELRVLRVAEESEREWLSSLAEAVRREHHAGQ